MPEQKLTNEALLTIWKEYPGAAVLPALQALQDAVLARQAERVAIATREAERKAWSACHDWMVDGIMPQRSKDWRSRSNETRDRRYPPLPPVARPSREITLTSGVSYRRMGGKWQHYHTGVGQWLTLRHAPTVIGTDDDLRQCAALLSEEQQDGQR